MTILFVEPLLSQIVLEVKVMLPLHATYSADQKKKKGKKKASLLMGTSCRTRLK